MMQKNTKVDLDEEWKELILEARELGLTVDQIRTFLKKAKQK